MSCQTYNRPYLLGVSDDGTHAILYRPDCKRWSCDHCARRRKAYLANKTYRGYEFYRAESSDSWSLITITSHEKLDTFEKTLWVMPKAWRKQKEKMRRRHNKSGNDKWRYCFVPELHKDNRVHMHLITNCQITEKELRDTCRTSGFGYITDKSEIQHAEMAAWYVAKYIGKQLDVVQWPRNFRRIRFTNHWPEPPSTLEEEMEIMDWKYIGDIVEIERYAENLRRGRGFARVDIVSQS